METIIVGSGLMQKNREEAYRCTIKKHIATKDSGETIYPMDKEK